MKLGEKWAAALMCSLTFALCPLALDAGLTGYLKVPDIAGESQHADHEDEIDIHSIQWNVETKDTGSGRTGGRPEVGPLKVSKVLDSSSPYLALSSMRAQVLPTLTLTLRSSDGEAHLDYLIITLTNVRVVSYEINSKEDDERPSEEVAFSFDTISMKYTVQEDDHSAGDEHEIEYDVAAGI